MHVLLICTHMFGSCCISHGLTHSAYEQCCRETYTVQLQPISTLLLTTYTCRPYLPYDSLIDMWCMTSCCSKLQAALLIACPAPLMGVMKTSDESERPLWDRVINCINNRQLLLEGEFRVWGGWVMAAEMRWGSMLTISLMLLTCQLAWHQISSAGTWPLTAASKQLQTSLRWNGSGGRQWRCAEPTANSPSHAGCSLQSGHCAVLLGGSCCESYEHPFCRPSYA